MSKSTEHRQIVSLRIPLIPIGVERDDNILDDPEGYRQTALPARIIFDLGVFSNTYSTMSISVQIHTHLCSRAVSWQNDVPGEIEIEKLDEHRQVLINWAQGRVDELYWQTK